MHLPWSCPCALGPAPPHRGVCKQHCGGGWLSLLGAPTLLSLSSSSLWPCLELRTPVCSVSWSPTPVWPAASLMPPAPRCFHPSDFSFESGTWCLSSTQSHSWCFFPPLSLSMGTSPCLCDRLVLTAQTDNKRWNDYIFSTQKNNVHSISQ